MPCAEHVDALPIARPHVVRAAPHIILPIDDAAVADNPARADMAIAEPNGSHPNSSSRIHCSLTMRPFVLSDSSAASSAASSAPLCP
jgi:hypothetical protein